MQYNGRSTIVTATCPHEITEHLRMLASSLLVKKKEGQELSDAEIEFLIRGFTDGSVADYQMSALAMAICLRGMNERETKTLTQAMFESGDVLPRAEPPVSPSGAPIWRVDKHSTGGLGDKISLVLAPLLASCGFHVPMISGRGLGLTGGTLDKLESIHGFRTDLSPDQSLAVLEQVGAFIVGATSQVAPADRKLYALRDVTGTVESIPLITASILSKKLAANLDALVLDVKFGGAAVMKTRQQADVLAETLVNVGCKAGLPTTAVLSDMDQPLGESFGNAIEVNEAVEVLRGRPGTTRDLTIALCCELMLGLGRAPSRDQALLCLDAALASGAAMQHFEKMVAAQGGKLNAPLPLADAHVMEATEGGYIESFDCQRLGEAIVSMGGGRHRKDDTIDPSVGIRVHGRVGDFIEKGQPILTLHCHRGRAADYLKALRPAVKLRASPVSARPLVVKRFGWDRLG